MRWYYRLPFLGPRLHQRAAALETAQQQIALLKKQNVKLLELVEKSYRSNEALVNHIQERDRDHETPEEFIARLQFLGSDWRAVTMSGTPDTRAIQVVAQEILTYAILFALKHNIPAGSIIDQVLVKNKLPYVSPDKTIANLLLLCGAASSIYECPLDARLKEQTLEFWKDRKAFMARHSLPNQDLRH